MEEREKKRKSDKEIYDFLSNLKIFLDVGYKIDEALQKIKGSEEILEIIRKGGELSYAFSKSGFPDIVSNLIKIAEKTGRLKEVLDEIHKFYEWKTKIESEIRSSLIWPSIVLIFSLGLILIYIFFVVPNFYNLLIDIGGTPTKTISIIYKISQLKDNVFFILGIIAGIGYIPFFIRELVGKLNFMRFALLSILAKSISISIKNGIDLPNALKIAVYDKKDEIIKIYSDILQGKEPDFKIFGEFGERVNYGFKAGNLTSVLDSVSEIFATKFLEKANLIKRLIEPIISLIVGAIIIIIFIVFYIPILSSFMNIM